MKYHRLIQVSILLSLLPLLGCKEKETDIAPLPTPLKNGFLILNEGTFNKGNASADFFSYEANKVTEENIFEKYNGFPMGDVLHSKTTFNNHWAFVINNSGKIRVTNQEFKQVFMLEGLNAPRYMTMNGDTEAYISHLYGNKITVLGVNGFNLSVKKEIPMPGFSEGMAVYGNELFVCMVKRHKVYVVNILSKLVTDSIDVGEEPQWIVKDKDNRMWVLCNYFDKKKPASLVSIQAGTHSVETWLDFKSVSESPSRLQINAAKDTLYFLNNDGVYRMQVNAYLLPDAPFIQAMGRNLYGLGVNQHNGDIVVSDALNYISKGKVYIYSKNGDLKGEVSGGIIPSEFHFIK